LLFGVRKGNDWIPGVILAAMETAILNIPWVSSFFICGQMVVVPEDAL